MTTTPEAANTAANHRDRADEPQPLSAYVKGTLRLQFSGGAVAERATSQYDARIVLAMQKEDRTSDSVGWASQQWFTWDDTAVVFSSFDAFRDQNWAISPEDRTKAESAGHPRGIIASLVDYWERSGRTDEPMYSVNAIVALYWLALDGTDRALWEAAAKAVEGRRGAEGVARVYREAEHGESIRSPFDRSRHDPAGTPKTGEKPSDSTRNVKATDVDDLAEPDAAPEEPADPDASTTIEYEEHGSGTATDAGPDDGTDVSAQSDDGDA